MFRIDREKIPQELNNIDLLEMQKDLIKQRKIRIFVISFLLFALVFTIVFGTLESPFDYTLSNIGNHFNSEYRLLFIIWALTCALAIQFAIIALIRLEEYQSKTCTVFVALATVSLIATGIVPAVLEDQPFWHAVHTVTSGLTALFLLLSIIPFVRFVSRENPRLRIVIVVWLGVVWIGSILMLIFLGKTGIFEIWFFVSNILFLLYLSLILFEEKIVKLSVLFLKDEDNLNLAIEKLFISKEKLREIENETEGV
ncbi:MAG: DUF998 domain-containing protein [Candidatus Izemoplasmatales bacterium]|nr:DUF998 domain-containing protein [Candidatus Izemoplasmatales bacterium]